MLKSDCLHKQSDFFYEVIKSKMWICFKIEAINYKGNQRNLPMMKKVWVFATLLLCMSFLDAQETRYSQDFQKQYLAANYEELYDLADLALLELQKEERAEAYLFKSIALFHFSKDPIQSIEYPNALRKSVKQLVKFKKIDKSKSYYQKYDTIVSRLIQDLKKEGDKKEKKGHTVIANYIHKTLDYHFAQEIAIPKDDAPIKTAPLNEAKITEQSETTSSSKASLSKDTEEMLTYAKTKIGIPYKFGGTTDAGYDCSGYTANVFQTRGLDLPRKSGDQATLGKKIDPKKAMPGDLLFFTKGGKINHVGIVVSNDDDGLVMIHASTSKGIRMDNVTNSDYWAPKLKFARRIL